MSTQDEETEAFVKAAEWSELDQLKADLHGSDPIRRQQAYALLGLTDYKEENNVLPDLGMRSGSVLGRDRPRSDFNDSAPAQNLATRRAMSEFDRAPHRWESLPHAAPDLSALRMAWHNYQHASMTKRGGDPWPEDLENEAEAVLEEVRRLVGETKE